MTLLALLVVAGVVRLTGGELQVSSTRITPALLLATNLGLGACIPLAWGLTYLIYRVRPAWIGSVRPGLRPRWLLTCVAITSVVWGVLFVLAMLGVAASPDAAVTRGAVEAIVVVVLTQPLQAAGEEYLFRGFLLQSLGATGLAAPVCWVASAAIFATAHGQFAPPLFADRFLIGVVFAWLATTTGGLEASIAVHAIKNMTVLIPAALLGKLSGAIEPTGVTWAPLVLDAVMLAPVAFWIRARSRRLARSSFEAEEPPTPLPPGAWMN